MKNKTLLNIAFIGLSILPLIGLSTQEDKLSLAVLIAFFIGLKGLYQGVKLNNKILGLILVSLFLTFKFGFRQVNYVYLEVIVYLMMYLGLSKLEAKKSLKTVLWCGFGLSIYAVFQFFGFDSIYMLDINNIYASSTPSYGVCATLGHPTYLGALLACLVPLAIKRNKWLALFMGIVVLMTKSDMAIGSMVVSLSSYWFLKRKINFIYGFVIAIIVMLIIGCNWQVIRPKIGDSGRFNEWVKINDTIKTGLILRNEKGQEVQKKVNLLGFGAGSFKKIYYTTENKYNYAHNEYLQIYFEFGIVCMLLVGLFLLNELFGGANIYVKMSLFCLCLNALGLFVWQLGFTRFLMVYLLCLNKQE